jgi:hypothetical protein
MCGPWSSLAINKHPAGMTLIGHLGYSLIWLSGRKGKRWWRSSKTEGDGGYEQPQHYREKPEEFIQATVTQNHWIDSHHQNHPWNHIC